MTLLAYETMFVGLMLAIVLYNAGRAANHIRFFTQTDPSYWVVLVFVILAMSFTFGYFTPIPIDEKTADGESLVFMATLVCPLVALGIQEQAFNAFFVGPERYAVLHIFAVAIFTVALAFIKVLLSSNFYGVALGMGLVVTVGIATSAAAARLGIALDDKLKEEEAAAAWRRN
jgi:hypothetical protein